MKKISVPAKQIKRHQAKRIQITPSERTKAILERYREITGKSMASMVNELLDESAPVLLETLEIIEKYKNKPTMAKDTIMAYAQSGHDKISAVERQIDDLFKPKRGRKPKPRAE